MKREGKVSKFGSSERWKARGRDLGRGAWSRRAATGVVSRESISQLCGTTLGSTVVPLPTLHFDTATDGKIPYRNQSSPVRVVGPNAFFSHSLSLSISWRLCLDGKWSSGGYGPIWSCYLHIPFRWVGSRRVKPPAPQNDRDRKRSTT